MAQFLRWPRRNRFATGPISVALGYVRQASSRVVLDFIDWVLPTLTVSASQLSPTPVSAVAPGGITTLDLPTLTGITADVYTQKGTCTITIASPAVVSFTAHGYSAGQAVQFTTTGALPTGLTAQVKYFVISPTANSFQVSTISGGAAVSTTGTQSGVHTLWTKI